MPLFRFLVVRIVPTNFEGKNRQPMKIQEFSKQMARKEYCVRNGNYLTFEYKKARIFDLVSAILFVF